MAIDEFDAVSISLEGPAPQRRSTVAFRLILAIPILFWAYLLSIPLYFAIIGIWFAALFTARVPDSLADFEARVLQFQLRQYAYAFYLMSDRWPSFALGPIDYPVELEVYEPPRMRSAPPTPSRHDPRRKPSGLRHLPRHTSFSGVSS